MARFVYDFWHTKCCDRRFGGQKQARKQLRLAVSAPRGTQKNQRKKFRPAR